MKTTKEGLKAQKEALETEVSKTQRYIESSHNFKKLIKEEQNDIKQELTCLELQLLIVARRLLRHKYNYHITK